MVLKWLDIRVMIHTDRFNNVVLQTSFSPHNKIEKRGGKRKQNKRTNVETMKYLFINRTLDCSLKEV